MLAVQRHRLIVEELRRLGAVRVSELTRLLAVSEMTVRRDLDALAAAGILEKVHGGATLRGTLAADEPGFDVKSEQQLLEKEAIARQAARLVEPGQSIGLTAGTTTWRLAHHLTSVPELTVVTNSIQVANVFHLEPQPGVTVILVGGVRTPSDALVGPVAVATIRSLHLDVLFMGVHGATEDAGLTTPNMLEAETDRALVDAAARRVVVADHTKWGIRGLSSIARLEDVHVFVTDEGIGDDARAALSEHVERVVVASTRGGRA
ncbi:MAG TPA: DeoR/GlpR family DNA-binding transcription regulator [Gaiellaceae bacterium]|jgi:DeoR/GlpR family transcriptional regulator of sugar metabolism